ARPCRAAIRPAGRCSSGSARRSIRSAPGTYVVLKPNITPIGHATGSVATHGSPWNYDRRVPILFWRPHMPAAAREEAIETADIMPTLAAMIGVPVAAGSVDGHCLEGIAGVACPPR